MLARGGSGWVAAAAVLAVAAALGVTALQLHPALLLLVLPLAFLLHFFRDPDRSIPPGQGLVSPADGKVLAVEETETGGTAVRVFMSPLDVHVNRAPCDGTVEAREHRPGGHRPAFDKDAGTNERMVWDLATDHGPVRIVQIAGAAARRIFPYVDVGDRVAKGDRIGIIRLGSRVDLELPPGLVADVRVGQRVEAGTTRVAHPRTDEPDDAADRTDAAAGPDADPSPAAPPKPAEQPSEGT